MQGVYKLSGSITGVTTAKTLAYIATATQRPIQILSAFVSCEDDATSEQMLIELNRISSEGTPTSTTVTPGKTEEGSSAFAGTCEHNVTASEPTYDASANLALKSQSINKLAGWEYVPTPEEREIIRGSDFVGLRLLSTITSSKLNYEIIFRELG